MGASYSIRMSQETRSLPFLLLLQSEIAESIRLIKFDQFKQLGTFPRCPDHEAITSVLKNLDQNDYENSLFIFISHCWLRGNSNCEGWQGKPHPDNLQNDKYKLCVEGIEKIMKIMAPGMKECYVWVDFSCIDQDKDPAGELRQLEKIVQISDCILTPIYDSTFTKKHEQPPKEIETFFNFYNGYGWNGQPTSYLNRGWCRVEMFYAANIPLILDSPERRQKFDAGILFHRSAGKRPHLLYGTAQSVDHEPPIVLPPLQNIYFEEYNPEKGNLSVESDRETIIHLTEHLRPYITIVDAGYEGEMVNGKKQGKGKYTFSNGATYEGDWSDDCPHGKGKYTYENGDIYDGDWKNGERSGNGTYITAYGHLYFGGYENDQKNGHGKFMNPNGDMYAGGIKNNQKHGHGKYIFISGQTYEGEFKNDHRDGTGKMIYSSGDIYEGHWKNNKRHGHGKYTYINGNIYEGEYKNDKKDGKGRYTCANGDEYNGQWKDNFRNGKGVFRYSNGDLYEGDFKNDKRDGKGKYTKKNGEIYVGNWKGDNREPS